MRKGPASEGHDDADRAGYEQGLDDPALEDEQRDRGGGEDGELPGFLEGSGEQDRRAQDRADRGRGGAVEERTGALIVA